MTEALRQKEKEITHAEENAKARELDLFNALVARVLDEALAWQFPRPIGGPADLEVPLNFAPKRAAH